MAQKRLRSPKQKRKAKLAKKARGPVTRAAAAAALGVAPARINRWVEDGAPVAERGSRGHSAMYDLERLREWVKGRGRPESGGAALSLGAARARLADAQAKKWERENLVRAGQLVEREVVIREGQVMVKSLQARLLALPRQVVLLGIIPPEKEPALRAQVLETLRELATWKCLGDTKQPDVPESA